VDKRGFRRLFLVLRARQEGLVAAIRADREAGAITSAAAVRLYEGLAQVYAGLFALLLHALSDEEDPVQAQATAEGMMAELRRDLDAGRQAQREQ
jgi:hypothetical protein